jgi:hypothetical protein
MSAEASLPPRRPRDADHVVWQWWAPALWQQRDLGLAGYQEAAGAAIDARWPRSILRSAGTDPESADMPMSGRGLFAGSQ